MASFAEYTRNKKRKNAANTSFKDYTKSILGEDFFEEEEDDIAPVKSGAGRKRGEEKEEDRSWFKKGKFSDGYQFGDVTKTILGSASDMSTNISAGIIGMGEKAVDTGAYVAGGVAGLFGQDKFKNKMSDFIEKDLYDEEEVAKKIGMYAPTTLFGNPALIASKLLGEDDGEKASIWGEKTDSLAQSGGQLAGTLALQAVGLPWWATTGVTSFGGEAEQALKQDSTYGEAGLSAAITAGADILTEKLFGGSGLGEKGLINLEPLTKGIANKAVKTLADFGIDVAGEGAEEVAAGFISNLGTALYKEESLKDILFSEEAIDEYIESFIGGAVLGGGMNSIKAGQSIKSGRDYRTGVSANEQKVVDAEVQKRVSEQEKVDGKKLTKAEKTAIEEEVTENLKKGFIDIDSIESALGGDTYKNYQSILEKEAPLNTELDEIRNNKTLTDKQKNTLIEAIQGEIKTIGETSNKAQIKEQLSKEVQEMISKDSFLLESYNERSRRSQEFEIDYSQYDEKQADAIKTLIEGVKINNTRRVHEAVDYISKIAADKGFKVRLSDTQKLKEMGFEVEGKTINGLEHNGEVLVNIESKKALNAVTGHEITHLFEGTDYYDDLKNTVIEYAKSKGEYNSRMMTLKKVYEKAYAQDADFDAKVERELVADIVGDYLFTDEQFISNLSTKQPNIFKKIYNEIKYMLKVATAGSEQARKLEKVKKTFDKVYKQSSNVDSDAKYALEDIANMNKKSYNHHGWAKVNDVLSQIELAHFMEQNSDKLLYGDHIKPIIDGRFMFAVGELFGVNNVLVFSDGKYNEVNNKGHNGPSIEKVYRINLNNETDIEELRSLIYERENDRRRTLQSETIKDYFPDGLVELYRPSDFEDFQTVWKRYESTRGKSKVNIKFDTELQDGRGSNTETQPEINEKASSEDGVFFDAKNTKFSLSEDTKGRTLTKEQQEYLVDSKIRDANGALKVMYHGSPNTFSVFDIKKANSMGHYGKGFYFTDSESHAGQYGNAYEVYLNITNPVEAGTHNITKEQLRKFIDAVAENEDYGIENYGYGATVDSVTNSVWGKDDFGMLMDINMTAVGDMVEAVKLFNEVNGTNYDGIVAPTETVAFYPNQIKTVDNAAPTSDADIRYSLSEDGKSEDVKKAEDYFGTTYSIKEAGYLLTDGKLLDFSGKKDGAPSGRRNLDHREITDAFDGDYGDDSYSGGMIQFMQAGNIRLSPESGGINLATKPNKAQLSTLDRYITNFRGEVILDIDDGNGNTVVSVEYPSRTYSKRIINDINDYFDKGIIPEQPSTLGQFRYSLSEDTEGRTLSEGQKEYFKDSKVVDGNGNLKVMYHGTSNADFTIFDSKYTDDGLSMFFTDSPAVAKGYSGTYETYIPDRKYTVEELTDIIGDSYYFVEEEDGKYHIFHNRYGEYETIHTTDTLEEMQEYVLEEYGSTGAGNYEVYLNLKKPLIVDAKGRNWDELPLMKTKGINRYNYIYATKGTDGTYNVEWEDMLSKYGDAESAEMSIDDIRNKFGEYVAEQIAKGRKDIEPVTIDSATKELIPRNTRQYSYYAKSKGYDGVIFNDIYDIGVHAANGEKYQSSTVAVAFNSEQIKSVNNVNPTSDADIRYSLSEEEQIYDYQSSRPKVRGGWTIEKIQKQLKQETSTGSAGQEFINFDSIDEIMDNIFYHGSTSLHKNLKAGSTIKEANRTGGYGEEYHSISLSKSKNVASNFTGMSRSGVVTPVLLRKGANVIEMPEIQDSIELEEMLPQLWEQKVDAVKIGNWDKEFSEQELVVLNPKALTVVDKGAHYFNVYQKPKFENLNAEEIVDLMKQHKERLIDGKRISIEKIKNKEGYYKDFTDEQQQKSIENIETAIQAIEEKYDSLINNTKLSLSNQSQDIAPTRGWRVYGDDIKLEEAPVREEAQEVAQDSSRLVQDTDYAPLTPLDAYIRDMEQESPIDESYMPDEVEEPYYEAEGIEVESPFDERDIKDVGKRKVKAYMYENPEVKPFFQEEAKIMLTELRNSIKGERQYNDQLYYDTNGEQGWFGTKRATSDDIAYFLDNFKYTYADIEKGLNAIIEDNGKENNAISKRIEFALNDRLKDGYTDFLSGEHIPANQDYINLLAEKQIMTYSDEAYYEWLQTLANEEPSQDVVETTEDIAPVRDDISIAEGTQQEFDYETGEVVDEDAKLDKAIQRINRKLAENKKNAYVEFRRKMDALQKELGSRDKYISDKALKLYEELTNLKKGVKASDELGYLLDFGFKWKELKTALLHTKAFPSSPVNENSAVEALVREAIGRDYDNRLYEIDELETEYQNQVKQLKDDADNAIAELEDGNKTYRKTRKELKQALIKDNKDFFTEAMDEAKNVSVLLLNNTDTIRANELVFGRENGKIINELIFQKAIDNESKSIAWQNKERKEIKALGIKPHSKESAAVQKYGEKQYEGADGKMVAYGDAELAQEFPDIATQNKIKNAARVLREKYDNYIDEANAVLTELGFNPINKRQDYMRHFEALTDAFSRMGIPFNPQSMKEFDLPTDINGITETFVPQKNFFANILQRKGNKTTLDAITGIDGYIGGISNLIHHTEDIQRGRAFEDLIRENYGRANAEKVLSAIEDESAREKRRQQMGTNHLSGYVKWVHDWTDNIAGKKDALDRAPEHKADRSIFAFLDTIRKQTGANMIGFNISSAMTNLVAPVQAVAKTDKVAFAKGSVDTFKNIFKKDDFMDKNSFLTARMGTDKISKTFWENAQNAGFIFMRGMDYFTSNLIVRSKYQELISKGMSEEMAHKEAGKFAARIMGDRTKGANAQLYNSKLFNMVAQFQLEVNNQVYSTFYDTYHESKEKAQGDAKRTAAGMTFTLGQLFIATHIFGQAFQSIVGYNPTLDIIDIIATALGLGDDEEEKPLDERLVDASIKLAKGLPYISTFVDGGRIPMSKALPLKELLSGKDDYGNEKPLWKTVGETLPYYLLPAGYNQIKKTSQGLNMFSDEHPVAGSYTDSGNLRFPIEDTLANRVQAGIFGQWASENARDYFNNERKPLKSKQIEEFADLDIPIKDYWKYREGLSKQETLEDKFDYIADLDLPVAKKNIMINNVVDRKEEVDLINYDDFSSLEEFDFATKYPEKYEFLQSINVSYTDYSASEDTKKAYNWAYEYPEKYLVSKAVGGVLTYKQYTSELSDIKGDKNNVGETISGSRKKKVLDYINGLDADYGAKIILYKSEYKSDNTYNNDIVEYLNNRSDISYSEMVTILTELDFIVEADGTVRWN